MTEKQWLNSFLASLSELKYESESITDGKWTNFMIKVMKMVGKKTNCRVVCRDPDEKVDSGEYLNIDAMFINKSAYNDNWKIGDWDPHILPSAVVELENSYSFDKIAYCLWKILCIRTNIMALICYQGNKNKILALKKHLESTVRKGNLMEESKNALFVIVGDDSEKNVALKDYFNIFEWRNGSLEKTETL